MRMVNTMSMPAIMVCLVFSSLLAKQVSANDTSVLASATNPFEPIVAEVVKEKAAVEEKTVEVKPKFSVKDYTVMGTLVSANVKIAMLRGELGKEFFVKVNDLLIDGENKVLDITVRGIKVTDNGEDVFLIVRNRSSSNASD